MNKLLLALLGGFILFVVVLMSAYTVDETQKGIILQFGRPLGDPKGAGLHFKLPWQEVILFDVRILDYDAKPREILTSDKKTLVVDNYAKWQIIDPLTFYRSMGSTKLDKSPALQRLDDIIYSELREALGRYTMTQVVSEKRDAIMQEVTERASRVINQYGIRVVDVRIKRTDLPEQNQKSIYDRMRAERQRQAKRYRSEGEEEAAKIRSQADRERTVLLADARREADVLRGEGDANATRIYAQSYGRSPEFYSFSRSLEAYEKGLSEGSRMILTPGTGFFRHLQ